MRLQQSKTGTPVSIKVGAPLKAALDATPRTCPLILVTLKGRPWTTDGFRTSWWKACAKAGISGVTFNDLRGTAVTRLALVGCTEPEIAAITGHTLRNVRSILDANYLHPLMPTICTAIRHLPITPSTSSNQEQGFPTKLPTDQDVLIGTPKKLNNIIGSGGGI